MKVTFYKISIVVFLGSPRLIYGQGEDSIRWSIAAKLKWSGKEVRADKRKALQYYKEAARNGSMVAGTKAEKLEKELGQ